MVEGESPVGDEVSLGYTQAWQRAFPAEAGPGQTGLPGPDAGWAASAGETNILAESQVHKLNMIRIWNERDWCFMVTPGFQDSAFGLVG